MRQELLPINTDQTRADREGTLSAIQDLLKQRRELDRSLDRAWTALKKSYPLLDMDAEDRAQSVKSVDYSHYCRFNPGTLDRIKGTPYLSDDSSLLFPVHLLTCLWLRKVEERAAKYLATN